MVPLEAVDGKSVVILYWPQAQEEVRGMSSSSWESFYTDSLELGSKCYQRRTAAQTAQ